MIINYWHTNRRRLRSFASIEIIVRKSFQQQRFALSSTSITSQQQHQRYFASSSSSTSDSSSSKSQQHDENSNINGRSLFKRIPFYGEPRQPFDRNSRMRSIQGRISLAIHHAITAFSDPTRADAVAALGEITGTVSLQRIQKQMHDNEIGRLMLKERPIVSKATIPYERLIKEASELTTSLENDSTRSSTFDNNITFGQAYGLFLMDHGFDPDERDDIQYIEDEELAYIMLRYRQCHDFWHTLTGLPPTVLGELGIKWLELFQTGLPIAALSSTVGSLRLDSKEREILLDKYLPWAIEISRGNSQQEQQNGIGETSSLMNVYYEKEFDTPLHELRKRLNIKPAPFV